jgi:protein TonB
VLNGKAVSKPAPSYPREALYQRVTGTVVVHITVDETGRVVEAEAVCGPALLHEASVRAARQARFTPTLLDGKPVKVSGTITYNFNIM